MKFRNCLRFMKSLTKRTLAERLNNSALRQRHIKHLLQLESLEDRTVPTGKILHDFGPQVDEIGGGGSFNKPSFVQAGSYVYFSAAVRVKPNVVNPERNELWVTNGTAAGTRMISDSTITEVTYDFDLTAVGNTMFFFANDSAGHPQLWSYSGSGTPRQITNSTSFFSAEDGMVAIGTTLYYSFIANGEYQLFSYNTASPS